MAVSKLTHATANIFMEQSFNDCLCNLGSTGTLVSNTAPSSTFPTPFPANPTFRLGLPMPAGSPAQLGSHQEHRQEHPLLQPPSYQCCLHWDLQNRPLQSPEQHHFVPALEVPGSVPGTLQQQTSADNVAFRAAGRGGKRTPTPDCSSVGTMGTLLLLPPHSPADPGRPAQALAANNLQPQSVCTGELCSSRQQPGEVLTVLIPIKGW